jgi:hypothetical protein
MPATVEAKTPAAPIMNELLIFALHFARIERADSVARIEQRRLLRGGHSRGKEEGARDAPVGAVVQSSAKDSILHPSVPPNWLRH